MSKYVLIWTLAFGIFHFAENASASRVESGDGTKYYINASGQKISAIDADKITTNDGKVYQCQPVEKVCSEKTGKCSIKAVK